MRLKVEPVFLDFSGARACFIKGLGGRKELAFERRYQGPELFNVQLEGVDRVVVYRALCPSSPP